MPIECIQRQDPLNIICQNSTLLHLKRALDQFLSFFLPKEKVLFFQIIRHLLAHLPLLRQFCASRSSSKCLFLFAKKIQHEVQQLKYQIQMEKPLTYNKISLEKRKQLVDLVRVENYSIAKAAKTLQIRNSTAKLIVKRFRETGTFFQPKRQRTPEALILQNASQSSPISQPINLQAENQSLVPHQTNQRAFYFCYGQNLSFLNFPMFECQNYFPQLSNFPQNE